MPQRPDVTCIYFFVRSLLGVGSAQEADFRRDPERSRQDSALGVHADSTRELSHHAG